MKFKDPKKLIAHLRKDLEDAHGKAVAKISTELDRVIESDNEFSDRGFKDQDIIDTGRLHDSKIVDTNGTHTTFTYDPQDPDTGEKYAAAVWLGFAYGRKYIPGRPWTLRAVKNENPTQNVAEALEAKGYDVQVVNDGADLLEGY